MYIYKLIKKYNFLFLFTDDLQLFIQCPANLCTVAEFSTLLSRYEERIFTIKSPLLAARRRILHLSDQGHSYFCIICSFLGYFCFHAREIYATSKTRDEVLLFS